MQDFSIGDRLRLPDFRQPADVTTQAKSASLVRERSVQSDAGVRYQ
jgi:hypothetical protein